MNYLNLFKTAKRVSKKSNKNYIIILFDMIYCGFKYMAGYVDYEVFEFYNLNKEQRKTVITRGINNKYVVCLNDNDYAKYVDDKILFNERYNQFLKRDWLDLTKTSLEDFKKYLQTKKVAIAKPTTLSCGKGVEKLVYSESLDIEKLYNRLLNNRQILIEDYVVQHEDLSKIYKDSVNTLRIVTILKDNEVNIPFISIRIGNSRKCC